MGAAPAEAVAPPPPKAEANVEKAEAVIQKATPVAAVSAPPVPVAATARPASPPAKLAPEAMLTLQLQGLQHEVARSRRRLWLLGGAAAGLFVLLLLLLTWRHFSKIFEYAEIAEVQFDPIGSGASVEIRYTPRSAGRFEMSRITPQQTEQLTEFIADSPAGFTQQKFQWDGSDAPKANFRVQFRRGWSLEEQTWSPPTGSSPPGIGVKN